jgi:hypothetical protein
MSSPGTDCHAQGSAADQHSYYEDDRYGRPYLKKSRHGGFSSQINVRTFRVRDYFCEPRVA